MGSRRFFLDQDQSSHWYIVPESYRLEWAEWCELAEDDEAGWTAPEWAKPVGGHPALVTFTNPR
jgi:hypothetical protein